MAESSEILMRVTCPWQHPLYEEYEEADVRRKEPQKVFPVAPASPSKNTNMKALSRRVISLILGNMVGSK